ncbi:MAG: Transcription regulator, partial [Capsulimonas sp.]|nr:Transcription regulator [Capsulimonas sp.]
MPSTTKNVIIVNPTAGRGEAGKQVPAIRRLLEADSADWIWLYTKARGDAERMAREAAANGASIVVAVGGDGTVHEVANGLLGSQSTLALIPIGTGNDLARALKLHGNLEVACRAVTHGNILHLDVGVIEGAGFTGPRHFLVIAGTGFDARTAQTVNEGVRWISGAPAYVVGAIKTLMGFTPFELTLTTDGEKRQTRAMFVSVANAETTGGGMKIAPGARVDDGQFDLCLVGAVPKLTLLHQLTKVFNGEHV